MAGVERDTDVSDWRVALASASGQYEASDLGPVRAGDPAEVGPYRIEAVLGQGGMGRVYLARDSRGEQPDPVAVKVLSWSGDAIALARFRRELDAARLVHAEGTAQVLDGDPEADPPWLATEYIAGPTLDRLVGALGPLPVEAAAGLVVGVAGALGAIHAAGVVHRDLKPSNIILAADGPRVVDFGIARTADGTALTLGGWSMGTPGYMAPEQVVGAKVIGPAADVFALGAVLVFACAGHSPYPGWSAEEVMHRIANGAPDLDAVPTALRGLAASCLARRAERRPSIEAIKAAALEIVERAVAARNLPTVEPRPASAQAAKSTHAKTTDTQPASSQQDTETPPGPADPPDPRVHTARTQGAPSVRPPRAGGRRRLALVAAGTCVVLAAGAWFAVRGFSHPSRSATTAAQPNHSARTAPSRPASPVFDGGTVLAGPGCAASPWAAFTITSPSLATGVGGGDPACGAAADAFRKSGVMTAGTSRAVWTFTFKRSVQCTLSVYIANAAPSSGLAVYEVTAGGTTQPFTVNQAMEKGRFVTDAALTGLTAADGEISVALTDTADLVGDVNHVTASAVSATCQLG